MAKNYAYLYKKAPIERPEYIYYPIDGCCYPMNK